MKRKYALLVFLVALLILLLFAGINSYLNSDSDSGQVDVFVGVDVAHDNVTSLKERVDEVKAYTNFFVIGSSGITTDSAKLNDVCQYLNDSGLHFATYTHTTNGSKNIVFNQSEWINYAKQRWSDNFLGLYAYDEPGGHQIDNVTDFMLIKKADNYSDAANKYVENLTRILSEFKTYDLPLLTSDYALYEFDYRAGYDVVLAEYAWNHSRPLNTALCRGSATMHGKEWGVMITYTHTHAYDTQPYLASWPIIYIDMVTAYQNGAKYIVVFDYAKDPTTNVTHGILTQWHLYAMKLFWQYAKEHPRTNCAVDDRMAYVLPKDYGYGFRGPNDWIWGLFSTDNLSSKIWNDVNTWVEQNKPKIDVIYEDTLQYGTSNYSKLVFWNGTITTK
jgi:hypothetical protein